jgi:hypothetical protein
VARATVAGAVIVRWAMAAGCALVSACASWPVVRSERFASPDASLEMVLVVREAPDRRQEATHEVFVDIDRPGENKGRFLHEEYRYLLKGTLDWKVIWQSSEMVTLHVFERLPDRTSRDVAIVVFVREPDGDFHPLLNEEELRREVA